MASEVILTFGSFMWTSCGIRKANSISQRMRILARLLILLRSKENTSSITLIDVLIPEYFGMIGKCAKELDAFSLKTKERESVPYLEKPSLPLKIGYTLEKCCSLKRSMGIKRKDTEMIDNAVNFLELYKLEWQEKIANICKRILDDSKFEKVPLLPLTHDLLKICVFLKIALET